MKNVVISFLIGCAISVGSVFAQASSDLLAKRIDRFAVQSGRLQSVLLALSNSHNVPVGIEVARNRLNTPHPVGFEFEDKTVGEILDSIFMHYPDYQWEVIDDVINVYPKAEREEILNVNIRSFSFTDQSVYRLRVSLTEIPEIAAKAKSMDLEFMTIALTHLDFGGLDKDFSIEMRDVSFRTLLNRIAIKRSQKPSWVVARVGETHEFIVVNF
jgi:hypothetical protein